MCSCEVPSTAAVTDLAEADVLKFGVVAEDQRGVNLIAGRDRLEDPGVVAADEEGHGHALHQAGNIVVGDGELMLSGIDGDYAAVERVTFFGFGL